MSTLCLTKFAICVWQPAKFLMLMKNIIKYFSKSLFGTVHLASLNKLANPEEEIKKLQKVGGMQFGTHWTAAATLQPCLTNIWTLAETKTIKFKVSFDVLFLWLYSNIVIEPKCSKLIHKPIDWQIHRIQACHAPVSFYLQSICTLTLVFWSYKC